MGNIISPHIKGSGIQGSCIRGSNIGAGLGGSFNPLQHDPILLLDGEQSVFGELNIPTLDWQPQLSSRWNSQIGPTPAITRTGVATRFNALGTLEEVPVDTGRVDFDPVTNECQGALIEPASNNRAANTDFSGNWSSVNVNDAAGSGFAGQNSRIITATANDGRYEGRVYVSAIVWVCSMWIRRISGSGTISIRFNNSSIAVPVTSQWTRFDEAFAGPGGGVQERQFGVEIAASGDVVEICMPQIEFNDDDVVTSFIPNPVGDPNGTDRGADQVTVSGADFTGIWEATKGTLFVECYSRTKSNRNGIYAFQQGTSSGEAAYGLFHDDQHLRLRAGSADQANFGCGVMTPGQIARLAVTWMANDFRGSLDGGAEVTDFSGSMPSGIDILRIGQSALGIGAYILNGHFRRLIYWPYHSTEL